MTVPTTSTTLLRDIGSSADNARWGEFVERYQGMMAGYLKPVGAVKDGECEVMIPNHELKQVFYSEIVQKVRSFDKNGGIVAVERALRERDPFLFGKYLAAYLKESASFFDTASESFYHGLVLGFIACFRNRFVVKSNRESGEGRYDISMRPLVDAMPGVVIELKAAEDETEDLAALAEAARRQIDTREYTTEMLADFAAHGEKRDILKFGMAFFGKNLVVCKDLPK